MSAHHTMLAASWPRADPMTERLMVIDPETRSISHALISELPRLLSPGDLLVLNDAATIPASLFGHTHQGHPIELRLASERDEGDWDAVLFGDGDWRTRTEHRPAPPRVSLGEVLRFGDHSGLRATVIGLSDLSERLLRLRFDLSGDALWAALYRHGRPVQYAHVREPLPLWHVQTPYASRPWAVEMPSAGRPLTQRLLEQLRSRGVRLATLTHAAGLSATGDLRLDAMLPLAERYEVSQATVESVLSARASGHRVVAVGTSAVRALESAARGGELRATRGVTELVLGPGYALRVVDGVLTGMHEAGTSHFELLTSMAPRELLDRSLEAGAREGYLLHEFGDSALVWRDGLTSSCVRTSYASRQSYDVLAE